MTSTSVSSGLWCGMLILMAFHCTRLYQLPRAAWSNKWPVPLTLQKQAPNKHRPVQLVDGQNLTYDKPTDILGWGGGWRWTAVAPSLDHIRKMAKNRASGQHPGPISRGVLTIGLPYKPLFIPWITGRELKQNLTTALPASHIQQQLYTYFIHHTDSTSSCCTETRTKKGFITQHKQH